MDIINAKTFKEKKFKVIGLTGELLRRYGDVEVGKPFFFWGESGSGKSTQAIKLFDFLTINYGKGLYIAAEEGMGKTLQDRVKSGMTASNNNYNLCSQKTTYKELIELETSKLSRQRYKVIVIDSYQEYNDMTYRHYCELKNALPWATIIGVNQMKPDGEPYGGNKIRHDADVKVCIKAEKNDMKVFVSSRYLSQSHDFTLYKIQKNSQKLTLFDNGKDTETE